MDEPIAGEIRLAASDRIPSGWAACDGQVLSISEHRALYEVIGNRYGGDGRRTFALPDLRGRVAIHADESYPLGRKGGTARHALTVAELPEHRHELLLTPATANGTQSGGAYVALDDSTDIVEWHGTAASGAAAAGHDNMQPYLGLVFMIALVGQSPARS
jgi:microcystin-dependent protein